MENYLFGLDKKEMDGLNHYVLEAKIFVFYSWIGGESTEGMIGRFHKAIMRVINIEKQNCNGEVSRERFTQKWGKFTEIYDFRGPDAFIYI